MSAAAPGSYPASAVERTRWILERRGIRNAVDSQRAYAFFNEREPSDQGEIAEVATILLTNRECPWKCVMCDLWKNTLSETVPPGAIVQQIEFALCKLAPSSILKLYNSGSFFDSGAIPTAEHDAIARLCERFDRLIVECHPRLVGPRMLEFAQRLGSRKLEVAMGLETAEPSALNRLNKRFTLGDFQKAANFLRENGFALRTFLLVHPPFLASPIREEWMRKSMDFAWNCGTSVVSLIPARGSHGAMEELARMGEFAEPGLMDLEAAVEYGLGTRRGRVFADLWDLQRFSRCSHCFTPRRDRLARMNLAQRLEPPVSCSCNG